MSEIPKHCPYKAGDRVQMHGFSGYHVNGGQHLNNNAVSGFRGVVEGFVGGTTLTGRTDDGRAWAECWGHLDPDLTLCHDNRCGCCPHPGRRMLNGRLQSGRCQPDQASAERARQAAQAHAGWWRTGVWPGGGTMQIVEQGSLFEVTR
jgi:hypothetical protein